MDVVCAACADVRVELEKPSETAKGLCEWMEASVTGWKGAEALMRRGVAGGPGALPWIFA